MKYLKKFNNISTSQEIIDILSVNEGFGDIFTKLKTYANKGILTASIVLAVALSSQSNQNSPTEIIKTGTELLQNNEKQLMYSFMVGISTEYASKFMKNSDIDNSGILIEIAKYYENLRDGKTPLKLSDVAKDRIKLLMIHYKNLDENSIQKYIQQGKTINHNGN